MADDSAGAVFLARSLGFAREEKPVTLNLEAASQGEQAEHQQPSPSDAGKREADAAERAKNREAVAAAQPARQEREDKDKLTTLKRDLGVLNAEKVTMPQPDRSERRSLPALTFLSCTRARGGISLAQEAVPRYRCWAISSGL